MSLNTAAGEVSSGRHVLIPAICGLLALVVISILIAACIDPQQIAPVLGEAPYP